MHPEGRGLGPELGLRNIIIHNIKGREIFFEILLTIKIEQILSEARELIPV